MAAHDDSGTAAALAEWTTQLVEALDLAAAPPIDEVLALAGVAAHAVLRPAAPLTTYLVGYAAGAAAASGAAPDAAFAAAARIAMTLAAARGQSAT